VQSGTATLALTSDGSTIDTLGTTALTALTAQTIAVAGTLYNYATASAAAPNPVDFGIVHVGQTVSALLSLGNLGAAGNLTEHLNAGFVSATAGITAGGTVAELVADGTNSSGLSVGLDTASAGTVDGSATLGLVSDGAGIDTLGTTVLAAQTIAVTGMIDNYATAQITEVSGGGTLTQSGTTYTLDLGTLTADSGTVSVNIGVLNAAIGPADLLKGGFSFEVPGGTDPFINSGSI
jgi:hypothetical protein